MLKKGALLGVLPLASLGCVSGYDYYEYDGYPPDYVVGEPAYYEPVYYPPVREERISFGVHIEGHDRHHRHRHQSQHRHHRHR